MRAAWLASERGYRRLAILTTAGVAFLTIAGAGVRLTGSGLGCDDWPRCNEERFIDVSTGHAAIEQLNRLASGLIGVPTLLFAVSGVLLARRGIRGVRWPAFGMLAMILANGVVGGLAVLGDLHPVLVQSHFILAMVAMVFGLVGLARVSPHWAPELRVDPGSRSQQSVVALAVAMVIGTAVALVTGTVVTGTGPHAGDEEARRFGFDLGSVARLHSIAVLVTAAVVVILGMRVWRDRTALSPRAQNLLSSWGFVGLLQGALGYTQYFADVPALMAWVHVVGATALWTLTLLFALSLRSHAIVLRRVGSGAEPIGAAVG